ncbi:hypothetical protein TTHERM_000658889 (macronuclear) [Tetrahymena thermophila SB210]|uniref:Uncharacterized protein n=1 Tax=Tetrahymena thermophila (strain SB210) TaxID=312017 RepID=W7X6N2_TETTS|nr:hypothetical protein TTHERM_000658889 [Tetrahymena thermophila SB210]EWS72033.1 hypothetical protein TTHERM_000658889 [Tetrahymena thermophila SB210]|eukprot:XP_012655440.1 hypothetical protein TTHERM_000658889 [Tetrahymena thermophila SB210]
MQPFQLLPNQFNLKKIQLDLNFIIAKAKLKHFLILQCHVKVKVLQYQIQIFLSLLGLTKAYKKYENHLIIFHYFKQYKYLEFLDFLKLPKLYPKILNLPFLIYFGFQQILLLFKAQDDLKDLLQNSQILACYHFHHFVYFKNQFRKIGISDSLIFIIIQRKQLYYCLTSYRLLFQYTISQDYLDFLSILQILKTLAQIYYKNKYQFLIQLINLNTKFHSQLYQRNHFKNQNLLRSSIKFQGYLNILSFQLMIKHLRCQIRYHRINQNLILLSQLDLKQLFQEFKYLILFYSNFLSLTAKFSINLNFKINLQNFHQIRNY